MPNPWLNEHKSTAAMGMNYFFSKHFSFSLLGFGKPFPKPINHTPGCKKISSFPNDDKIKKN
jgi:hypothetical protein